MITLTTTMIAAIATFDPAQSRINSHIYNEGPRCVVCGDEYTYDYPKGPSPCCDDCAHEVVEAMAALLNSDHSRWLREGRPQATSDITEKRIERELLGPSISVDGLYKDTDVRPHFYAMIDDVTRLSAALAVLFPTAKPLPREGAIDRSIRYLELLKSARDTACEAWASQIQDSRHTHIEDYRHNLDRIDAVSKVPL